VKRMVMLLASVGLLLTGVEASTTAAATAAPTPHLRAPYDLAKWPRAKGLHAQPVCAQTPNGIARCLSLLLVDGKGNPFTTPAPSGLGPADFQDAYNLPSDKNGKGITVALVDAYHNPNVEADLAVYRSTYGLPACTTANGCFKEITSAGNTRWPRTNTGWGLETSLDVDMVSAICPNCNILLVDSYGGWIGGLGKAVNQAVKQGAYAVSNSYGNRTRERKRTENLGEKYYNHPGVAVVAATGDSGYDNFRTFPAASQYVIAVGGTYLHKDSSKRGWTETAWAGAGSGCAPWDPKPKWQSDKGCKNRTYADVAADASPTSGAAVYDTFGFGGWLVVGGTSESSPIIASVFALAGDDITYAERVYQNPEDLYDITQGSNGSCGGSYLCTAGAGYDGPTGLGTPNGIGDF
jgi:subtilase family serine protease